jgi:23S rRNA pseudouridine2457 synthase
MGNPNSTKRQPHYTYVIFNKPYGVLSQFTDEMGRKTLKNFVPINKVYPVGRLDFESEGLLFLTNDGLLNQRLSHPAQKAPKTYLVQVEGYPTDEQIMTLKKGVMIEGKRTIPAKVKRIEEPALWERTKPIRFRKTVPTSWLEVIVREGMNHQVRRMTASVGLPCLRLVRTAIGPIKLGNLEPGRYMLVMRPHF